MVFQYVLQYIPVSHSTSIRFSSLTSFDWYKYAVVLYAMSCEGYSTGLVGYDDCNKEDDGV